MSEAARPMGVVASSEAWIGRSSERDDIILAGAHGVDVSGMLWSGNVGRLRFSGKPVREYTPSTYRTMLSEQQLTRHGLKTLSHEAENWLVAIDADDLQGVDPAGTWRQALRDRVVELRELAADDDLPFSQASADAALAFATSIHAAVRPAAFLVGNGNVRLVWENQAGEQIGLQFLDTGLIQYVLFADRRGRITENLGTDDRDSVLRFINAAGLRHLLRS